MTGRISPAEMEKRASLLLEAAKMASHPARRQKLVSEALELQKDARRLRSGAGENGGRRGGDARQEVSSVSSYKLWLYGYDDEAIWIAFNFANRAEAVWATDALASACAESYEAFELWEQSSLLYSGKTTSSIFSLKTAIEVTRVSQQSVLDTEVFLRDSRLAIARSSKLLAATGRLQEHIQTVARI